MVQSYTASINTNKQYQNVESITNITFTTGNTYTMQVQNFAYIKIANAVFTVSNEKFQYKAGADDLYIKTNAGGCVLTILEDE